MFAMSKIQDCDIVICQVQYQDMGSGHCVFPSRFSPVPGEQAGCILTVEVCVLCLQGTLCPVIPVRVQFHSRANHTSPGICFKIHLHSLFIISYFNVLSPHLRRGNSAPLTKLQLISFIPQLESTNGFVL